MVQKFLALNLVLDIVILLIECISNKLTAAIYQSFTFFQRTNVTVNEFFKEDYIDGSPLREERKLLRSLPYGENSVSKQNECQKKAMFPKINISFPVTN